MSLVSCGNEAEIETEVRYSVYENDGIDTVSFYMTSDINADGEWEYEIGDSDLFEIFHTSEETNEIGNFFNKTEASYKTLVLKPLSEGKTVITFSLDRKSEIFEYNVAITKDSSGIFRVKIERLETN